jgi:hypothetical protein
LIIPSIELLTVLAALSHLMVVRVYQWTLWTGAGYDEKGVRSFEAHFKASLAGNIRRNRKRLANRAVPFFQRMFHKQYGRKLSPHKIRIRFERLEPGLASRPEAQVQPLELTFKGKMHHAKKFPPMVLNLSKYRRRTKVRRRKVRRTGRKPVKRQRRRGQRSKR